MAQTHRQTDRHGDSMTNSAQWGRVGENYYYISSFSSSAPIFFYEIAERVKRLELTIGLLSLALMFGPQVNSIGSINQEVTFCWPPLTFSSSFVSLQFRIHKSCIRRPTNLSACADGNTNTNNIPKSIIFVIE